MTRREGAMNVRPVQGGMYSVYLSSKERQDLLNMEKAALVTQCGTPQGYDAAYAVMLQASAILTPGPIRAAKAVGNAASTVVRIMISPFVRGNRDKGNNRN